MNATATTTATATATTTTAQKRGCERIIKLWDIKETERKIEFNKISISKIEENINWAWACIEKNIEVDLMNDEISNLIFKLNNLKHESEILNREKDALEFDLNAIEKK